MPSSEKFPYRLLTPGPVPLFPQVQKALAEPMIHHRTPEFQKIYARVAQGLKEVFCTKNDVFIHTSTGSGSMESAIVNTLSPGDKIISIVSGKFGERWAQIASAFGINVVPIQVPWGHALDPKDLDIALTKNSDCKAVLVQACETSTATINPIKKIAEIIHHRPTLLIVDGITAVGAMELPMDDWGIDVLIGGSQKAFMLPTGLSFISLSEKAWQFNKISKCPKYYWDLASEKLALSKGESQFSSAVSIIRALDVVLPLMTGPNKSKMYSRINALAMATRAAGEALTLSVFSKCPSPSVTALSVPTQLDSQKLRSNIESKYNLTLMGGQDSLKGKILRIGHLGYITDEHLLASIEILYLALKDHGVSSLSERHLNEALALAKKHLKEYPLVEPETSSAL